MNNIGTDHGAIPRPGGSVSRSLQLQGAQWVQVANGNEVNFLGSCSNGDLSNSSDLFLGRLAPALGANYFTGRVDELMYFKYAYTKADLDSIYNNKCQGKCLM